MKESGTDAKGVLDPAGKSSTTRETYNSPRGAVVKLTVQEVLSTVTQEGRGTHPPCPHSVVSISLQRTSSWSLSATSSRSVEEQPSTAYTSGGVVDTGGLLGDPVSLRRLRSIVVASTNSALLA